MHNNIQIIRMEGKDKKEFMVDLSGAAKQPLPRAANSDENTIPHFKEVDYSQWKLIYI